MMPPRVLASGPKPCGGKYQIGDYMEKDSTRAENPSPVFRIFKPGKRAEKSHVIKTEFQPELKSELGHAFSVPF